MKNFYDNTDLTPKEVGASELYLLSWIDAIERLDILLLEARHLQTNIINDLREPALLLALRYEEDYLWGERWEASLETQTPLYLARKWIIGYPDRKNIIDNKDEIINGLVNNEPDQLNERANIKNRIALLIDSVWHKGGWGKEQRSNYYSLRAIQFLKREILRDKLELSYHAIFVSHLHRHSLTNDKEYTLGGRNIHKRAEFMVLRGAILHKASKDYV